MSNLESVQQGLANDDGGSLGVRVQAISGNSFAESNMSEDGEQQQRADGERYPSWRADSEKIAPRVSETTDMAEAHKMENVSMIVHDSKERTQMPEPVDVEGRGEHMMPEAGPVQQDRPPQTLKHLSSSSPPPLDSAQASLDLPSALSMSASREGAFESFDTMEASTLATRSYCQSLDISLIGAARG